MKKKCLAIFIVCIGLCFSACGTNESETDQNSGGQENDSDYETETDEDVSYGTETNTDEEDYVEDISEAETDYDMEDTDVQETEETTGEEEHISSEPSGLIILNDTKDAGAIKIVSVQPESGEQQEIASFFVAGMGLNREGYFYQWLSEPIVLSDSMKQKFSYDYTKLAATKTFTNDMESHAGWIENDGTFFDVTEKLGLQSKSDFDDPVHYKAIGFTEDGYFMFCDSDHDYYVPLDNLSSGSIEEGSLFSYEDALDDFFHDNLGYASPLLTDWVNDHVFVYQNEKHTDYLGASSVHSRIGDLETGETTEYIPGSKYTWDGVVSPDGKTIAFMSNASGDTAIYTIPVAGGEPVELHTDMGLSNPSYFNEEFYTTLIDWR